MKDETDITGWPVEQLNELCRFAYAGVAGVELVDDSVSDDVAEHGVNTEDDKA